MASDDDEEIIYLLEDMQEDEPDVGNYRQRRLRRRENLFHKYDDDEFIERFRLSKATVLDILHLIEDDIKFTSQRNSGLTASNQLLLTLRFYATGAYQQVVGDFTGVHRSTACRSILRVSRAIAALRARYIKLPESIQELTRLREGFYRIAGVPRVGYSLFFTLIHV